MVSNYKILKIAQNRSIKVLFAAEHEYDTLRYHISSMSQEYESFEKRVSDYKILETDENTPTMVVFDTEHEYDTLGCHISSWNHVTPKKRCQITKKELQIGLLG